MIFSKETSLLLTTENSFYIEFSDDLWYNTDSDHIKKNKVATLSQLFKKGIFMSELMKYAESADLYSKISNLITAKKYTVSRAVNSAIVFLYWEIGETICKDILQNHKAEYGKNIINEVAKQLSQDYGKGFDLSLIHISRKFYPYISEKTKVQNIGLES